MLIQGDKCCRRRETRPYENTENNFSSLSEDTKKDGLEEVTFDSIPQDTVKQEWAREDPKRRLRKKCEVCYKDDSEDY